MWLDKGQGNGFETLLIDNAFFDCVNLVKQIVLLTASVKICIKWHCCEKTPTFCLQLAQKTLYIDLQKRKNIMYGLL